MIKVHHDFYSEIVVCASVMCNTPCQFKIPLIFPVFENAQYIMCEHYRYL